MGLYIWRRDAFRDKYISTSSRYVYFPSLHDNLCLESDVIYLGGTCTNTR